MEPLGRTKPVGRGCTQEAAVSAVLAPATRRPNRLAANMDREVGLGLNKLLTPVGLCSSDFTRRRFFVSLPANADEGLRWHWAHTLYMIWETATNDSN